MDAEQSNSGSSSSEIDDLHLVIASQREVIAQLQRQHEVDQARIDALSQELTAVLRST